MLEISTSKNIAYNKLMNFLLSIFILFTLNCQSQASDLEWGRIHYQIKEEKNIFQILEKFFKPGTRLKKSGRIIKIIHARNDHIGDWESLEKGEFIDLYIPKRLISAKKFKAYLIEKKRQAEMLKKQGPPSWRLSCFYMASYGRFNQKENKINIDFQQNSPISLGFAGGHKLGEEYSLNGSIYFSYLTTASSSLNGDSISVRPEIGGNVYLSKKLKNLWSIYGGIDFERFTTFNINGIRTTGNIFLDENRVSFITLGVDKIIPNSSRLLLVRFSVSPVMSSQRFSYDTGDEFNEAFSGFKFLVYLNASINERYYFHVLYKHHIMSGPSDLYVSRIGFGAGYKF